MRRVRRRGHDVLPTERTWIHPSELPGSFESAALPPPRPVVARRFQVAVASAASALLATGGFLLASSATSPAGATVGPHTASTVAMLPSSDRAAARAMVALVIFEDQHVGAATAMVVPPGDIAITTAPIPAGASVEGWVDGVHHWLSVVGTDPALGITVLKLPHALHVTPIGPLEPAIATGGAPTSLTSLAAIPGATTPVEFEYADTYLYGTETPRTIGDTEIATANGQSLAGVISGTVVLDAQGRAVAVSVPTLGGSSFVPATFLELLAQRIAIGDASDHGWLQLSWANTPSGIALVQGVSPHGNVVGRLLADDQIVAINSQPVTTIADVDSILYTRSPKEIVTVKVLRHGVAHSVNVVLSSSP